MDSFEKRMSRKVRGAEHQEQYEHRLREYMSYLPEEAKYPFDVGFSDVPEQYRSEFMAKGFNLANAIEQQQLPSVEIAGPTLRGFELMERKTIGRSVFTSNITPGLLQFNDKKPVHVARVDFAADATKLPLKNECVGAIFASCLPAAIREQAIEEAFRVLAPGGLLVWQGGGGADLAITQATGFQVAQLRPRTKTLEVTPRGDKKFGFDAVFKKPE